MNEKMESGIFKQIQVAVQPLVTEGDFRFEMIEYEAYDRLFRVLLPSPEVDISFIFKNWEDGKGNIFCHFKVKNSNKQFGARSLFSAFHIGIPVNDEDTSAKDHSGNPESIEEISRLSREIKKHLPEILDLFRPERVEETKRLSLIEHQKLEEIRKKKLREPQLAKTMVIPEENTMPAQNEWNLKEIFIFIRNGFQKPLTGDLEAIRETLRRCRLYPDRYKITYHGSTGKVDILFSFYNNPLSFLTFIINHEADDTVASYFLTGLSAPYGSTRTFIQGREELIRDKKQVIYPGKNVFRMLGIPYTYKPKGYIADLGELCILIRYHLPELFEAFSEKNIRQTYETLIAMEGNNDEEIQNLIRHYFDRG